MPTITIEISKKILQRGATQRLMVVDPGEYHRLLKIDKEIKDAKEAKRIARQEWKQGKRRFITNLRELTR